MTATVYLLLGANLGDRAATLQRALEAMLVEVGPILRQSSIYETAAWGITDQPSFLNQVLSVLTVLPPDEILVRINAIEQRLGRVRHEKWGSRVIDIDILYVDNQIIQTESLTVPHLFLHERRFTLVPLVEIAPDYVHPLLQKTNQELLDLCPDVSEVKRWQPA